MKKMIHLGTVLIIFVNLMSCKSQEVKIVIDNSYRGPCVLFIKTNSSDIEKNTVYVHNGLGCLGKSQVNHIYTFTSDKYDNPLEIVPIGNKDKRDSNRIFIYQLVKGESQLSGFKDKLQTVRFFIGSPIDFAEWDKRYIDELEHLNNHQIDWKKYYFDSCLLRGNVPH